MVNLFLWINPLYVYIKEVSVCLSFKESNLLSFNSLDYVFNYEENGKFVLVNGNFVSGKWLQSETWIRFNN